MAWASLHRGVTDADITQLEASGAVYRMVAWSTTTQVRAKCWTIHEQGQPTLLFDKVVSTAAANHEFDSVRCVHSADQYLVVLWLDRNTSAGTYELDGAWLDVENTSSVTAFTGMAAIAIDDAGLYDAKQVENATGTSEYMIAYATSTTAVQVRRVTGSIITASAWSVSVTTNHAARCLAVHGDATAAADDGGVVIAYQDGTNDLEIAVLDFNDGTLVGTFDVFTDTTSQYTAVGIARTDDSEVMVIAEALFHSGIGPSTASTDDEYVPTVLMRHANISGFTGGATTNAQRVFNVCMLSKPYSYTDAEVTPTMHVYCGLGYKTVDLVADWQEHVGMICDMQSQEILAGASVNSVRPLVSGCYSQLNIDTTIHAYSPEGSASITFTNADAIKCRRMNHMSNWIPGPTWLCDSRKTRTVVWPGWRKRQFDSVEIDDDPITIISRAVPSGATFEEITHYLEDPWTRNRDAQDPAQPSVNFHGANPLSLYSNVEVQEELVVAGGMPYIYDGTAFVELGFPWVPEIIEAEVYAPGTLLGAGTYNYLAVYEWTDQRGQLHRSGYGTAATHTSAGGDGVILIVRTMTVSMKEADWHYPRSGSIVIAIYRDNPSQPGVFRRIHAQDLVGFLAADVPINDPTNWAIEIVDDVPEVRAIEGPTLTYQPLPEMDELPPSQPPPSHLTANWQNRAWLASSEEPELWYSKENLPTPATGQIAPEFNPGLRYRLDVVRGEVTGLQPMDDALIIFTRDGIYSLTGVGATVLGESQDYNLSVLHEGTGCIEPRSIALTPAGILFQSYKGVYLLSKGGELDFISTGAQIEDLIRTSGNLRSGEHLPDRHLVAFVANSAVTDGPQVIKYDYYHRLWSTSELEPPHTTAWLSSTAGGCAWRGNERDASHVVLCQGSLLIERGKDDSTPYRDEDDTGAAEAILLDIETGWINLTGVAGYKRVREIGVQTDVIGTPGNLVVQLDVDATGDYSVASPESHTFSPAPAYMRVRPLTPKMSAFRLRLVEPAGTAATENRKITGFTVHVGRKKGPRKVPDAQQG